VLDCKIIYILLLIENNGDASPGEKKAHSAFLWLWHWHNLLWSVTITTYHHCLTSQKS